MSFKVNLATAAFVRQTNANIEILIKGNFSFKGKIYGESNIGELFSNFVDLHEVAEFIRLEILPEAYGQFFIIIRVDGDILIANDIIRTYPLYYSRQGDDFIITDNFSEIYAESHKLELDDSKVEEYIASGFVFGNATIYKNIYALQAGEMIVIKDRAVKSYRYFEFKPSNNTIGFPDTGTFVSAFNELLTKVIVRMLKSRPDTNNWIVPLSGGHDSRIIVNCLYLLGVKNVICFSYGTPGNQQSAISKKVADALGYEWYFVEYTEQKWNALHKNGILSEYVDFAFGGNSTPHLQDFLAVFELREKNIIKKGDVFVPGHTLDFISGNHLTDLDFLCKTREDAIRRVLTRHSRITNQRAEPVSAIKSIYDSAGVEPQQFQEYFNWQERQGKFIVNSIRAYEFLGFDVCVPFWDKELVEFWLRVSPSQRKGRNLLLESERKGILAEVLTEIPYEDELRPKKTKKTMADKIKGMIPKTITQMLLRLSKKTTKSNEGLNLIYAMKASTVKEIIGPLEGFPRQTHTYLEPVIYRLPYQMNYHFLSCLYAIKMQLDKKKRDK